MNLLVATDEKVDVLVDFNQLLCDLPSISCPYQSPNMFIPVQKLVSGCCLYHSPPQTPHMHRETCYPWGSLMELRYVDARRQYTRSKSRASGEREENVFKNFELSHVHYLILVISKPRSAAEHTLSWAGLA
jgi:hypothetical protein